MSLKKCPSCGNEVSDSARRCPKCGGYIWSSGRIGCAFFLLICVVLFFIGLCSGK